MSNLLITAGCSWTYGVGAGYESNMTAEEYDIIRMDNEICSRDSFRGIISRKYGFETLNFSAGGSSNQRQFRLLKEFFINDADDILKSHENILVLHGITSIYRNEIFIKKYDKLIDILYTDPKSIKYSHFIVDNFFNENNELKLLANEIQFFSKYYDSMGIKYLWFDTFNHHEYLVDIKNLMFSDDKPRDLLSKLVSIWHDKSTIDNKYHHSTWALDTNRISLLIEKGIINPISKHPTKKGHELIANFFSEYIEQLI